MIVVEVTRKISLGKVPVEVRKNGRSWNILRLTIVGKMSCCVGTSEEVTGTGSSSTKGGGRALLASADAITA